MWGFLAFLFTNQPKPFVGNGQKENKNLKETQMQQSYC